MGRVRRDERGRLAQARGISAAPVIRPFTPLLPIDFGNRDVRHLGRGTDRSAIKDASRPFFAKVVGLRICSRLVRRQAFDHRLLPVREIGQPDREDGAQLFEIDQKVVDVADRAIEDFGYFRLAWPADAHGLVGLEGEKGQKIAVDLVRAEFRASEDARLEGGFPVGLSHNEALPVPRN